MTCFDTWFYYVQSRYYDPAIGRFINADAFASTGQGILGNNMFAYCNNNPVNNVDYAGNMHEAIDPSEFADAGALIYVDFGIATVGIAIGEALDDVWHDFEESVKKSLAKITTARTYRSETEEHHMVARGAYKAHDAQIVLAEVFPDGTENPINKVTLTTDLHRRIHNNFYYAVTNSLIVHAYESANGNKILAQQNVISTLNDIRGVLEALQMYVPY